MTADARRSRQVRMVPLSSARPARPSDAPTEVLAAVGAPAGARTGAAEAPLGTFAPEDTPRLPGRRAARPEPDRGAGARRGGGPDRPGGDDDHAGDGEGTAERRRGMGTPALVLGVLAVGTCWTGWAGVVLGLFAVAAGFLGARRAWAGLATDGASSLGGFGLGLVGLVVGTVVVWPTLFGTGNFGDGLTLDQCLEQAFSAHEMHMCKSQHITEFNQRFPNSAE